MISSSISAMEQVSIELMISGLPPLNKGTSLRLLKTDASKVPQYLWAEAFHKAVHINY